MVDISSNWEEELERWLEPFLDCLGHKARRRMCPLYVAGLIGPQGYRMLRSISTRKLSSQAARLSLPRREVFVSG